MGKDDFIGPVKPLLEEMDHLADLPVAHSLSGASKAAVDVLVQDSGLEWVFRFWAEPSRLWKRYLHLNPLFVLNLVAQKTGMRRFNPADSDAPASQLRFG